MALNYDNLPAMLAIELGKATGVIKNLIKTVEQAATPETVEEHTKEGKLFLLSVSRLIDEIYKESSNK